MLFSKSPNLIVKIFTTQAASIYISCYVTFCGTPQKKLANLHTPLKISVTLQRFQQLATNFKMQVNFFTLATSWNILGYILQVNLQPHFYIVKSKIVLLVYIAQHRRRRLTLHNAM